MITTEDKLVIKKHIRLIAEKFQYSTSYTKESVILENTPVSIEIDFSGYDVFNLKHTINDTLKQIVIKPEALYDYIIQAFIFPYKTEIAHKKGELISLEIWASEEFISLKKLLNNIEKIKSGDSEEHDFGGNRIMAEYYKGIILVRDDLAYYKANVLI